MKITKFERNMYVVNNQQLFIQSCNHYVAINNLYELLHFNRNIFCNKNM